MSGFIDNLELRPHERRLLVGVALVTFVVLNAWFIWPHRHDLAKVEGERAAALATLASYQEEIARLGDYRVTLEELEGEGASVPTRLMAPTK